MDTETCTAKVVCHYYLMQRQYIARLRLYMYAVQLIKTVEELLVLRSVFSKAFEQDYSEESSHFLQLLNNPHVVLLGAYKNAVMVGGLIAFELLPIHGVKELYLYDIAVDPSEQRKGVGTELFHQLVIEAKLRGVETIFVDAELDDEAPVQFYATLGGKAIDVKHFSFTVENYPGFPFEA